MNMTAPDRSQYTQLIYRPFWITITVLLIILSIALAVLINSSWRALHRTEPLIARLALIEELQQYNAELDDLTTTFNNTTEKNSQVKYHLYFKGVKFGECRLKL